LIKEKIRKYIMDLGVDDVGFANVEDYHSPKSYPIETFLPGAKTIISLVFRELDTCESPSVTIAMNGRLDMNYFQRSCSYQINRFLKKEFQAKIVDMPYSSPMELHKDRMAIGDFSQRHAAVAAGMGTIGRHNLVIHPRFGTRIGLTALITNLELEPDVKIEQDLCIHCDLCVKNAREGLSTRPVKPISASASNTLNPMGYVQTSVFGNSLPTVHRKIKSRCLLTRNTGVSSRHILSGCNIIALIV
jgi:epoxyqueuosine reductase